MNPDSESTEKVGSVRYFLSFQALVKSDNMACSYIKNIEVASTVVQQLLEAKFKNLHRESCCLNLYVIE